MATKEVKEREARGEDLRGIVWEPEKPYMLVRAVDKNMSTSFFYTPEDFYYAVKKASKNNEEILYAAKIEAFQKIDDYKSGCGRKTEVKEIILKEA